MSDDCSQDSSCPPDLCERHAEQPDNAWWEAVWNVCPDDPIDAREQPAPQRGVGPATWDLVIADMRARDAAGLAKYGVRHQPDNGRDHMQDVYEELLDAAVYMRALMHRRDGR